MGIDQVLVMGVVLVLILGIFVSLFDMVLPIIVKGQFDDLCRNYILLSETQNGLDHADIMKLTVELGDLGISDLDISYKEKHEVTRGGIHAFEVSGIFKYSKMQTVFKRARVELPFTFKRDFIARKVVQ